MMCGHGVRCFARFIAEEKKNHSSERAAPLFPIILAPPPPPPHRPSSDGKRNLFFDAPARPLAAAIAALRIRLYGLDDRAPRPRAQARRWRIDAGISRVEEDEDPLDPALALACINDPARLRLICDEYGVWGDTVPFVCLGGFQNTCGVYGLEEGEGLVLVIKGNVLPCCGIAERKTIGEMEQVVLVLLVHLQCVFRPCRLEAVLEAEMAYITGKPIMSCQI